MSRHNPERVKTWRVVIEAWKQSGQTIHAFCRDRKLNRSNFDRWRRIFAAEPSQAKPSSPSAFVPLQIVAEPMVEIVLVSGITVRLVATVRGFKNEGDVVELLSREVASNPSEVAQGRKRPQQLVQNTIDGTGATRRND